MKILHYSLGFPPYRSGGMTKYVIDLMEEQIKQGHHVSLLWPSTIKIINKKSYIKHSKGSSSIESYELINPLPVPLLNGIEEVDDYIQKCDITIYRNFLENLQPEVIHIHTLMGIHKEFFEVAKELKIKIIYTSHDYFGICPKVNLLYNDVPCNNNEECLKCSECNKSAFSKSKIIILQSSIYRKFKTTKFVKKLKEKYKKSISSQKEKLKDGNLMKLESVSKDNKDNEKYIELRKYYLNMFNMVDTFHFNSSLAKDIYFKYINVKDYKIISILHKDIKDNRINKEFKEKLKITYLGPTKAYKGFYLLKKVLDSLYSEGFCELELNIYYSTCDVSKYMNVYDGYNYSELKEIFKKTDLLVAPSIWYETFGFVVIEAYSFGVPVVLTKNVGAKDIIENNKTGIIIGENVNDLKSVIKDLYINRYKLKDMNKEIVKDRNVKLNYENHVKDIVNLYLKE